MLDRYRLRRRLGAGAFGTVWLAFDERLAREVAVKEIPVAGAGPGAEERGRREALAAARLAHPGIVMLYEAGAEEGRVLLASELVRGENLQQLLARGELSDRDVLRIGVVLCDALAHAHAHGVIHRDVKPSNVLVPDDPERGAGAAKLTDFGVAHVAGDEALTHTGDVVGTLAYMAPEQAEGRRVTPAADLYALALVLFEGLSGVNPVRAASPVATARRLGSPLPSLAARRPDLPEPLTDAIDRALDVDPDERGELYDLREALVEVATEVSDEGGTIVAGPLDRAAARRPRGLGRLGGALAAGTVSAVALAAVTSGPPVSPAAAGAAVAVAVAALPRMAWLLAALAATLWLLVDGRTGTAGVAALALAGPPLLLPRRGTTWSVPGLAPLLGALSLGVAYPALAGRAGSLWRRAALGALGAGWLLLLGLVAGQRHGGPSPARVGHALTALAGTGTALLPAVWAAAAAVLPWLVRGRSLVIDVPLAAAWAAGLAAAVPGAHLRGAAGGAVLAAVLALAAPRVALPRANRRGFRSMAPSREVTP